MTHETPIDDTWAEKVSQLLELESAEEKDHIVADVLENGRQALVKYENVLVPDVYSGEINKSNKNSTVTADTSSEETPLLKLLKQYVYQQWEMTCKDQPILWLFINKVKDENNDHYELILRRTAEYGTTYTKSSSILAIVLQLLFQGIDDDCLTNKDVFSKLWSSVTDEGLKACNNFADYIAEDDLKQQLDDPVSPLFQALRTYYDEKLPELFKKHSISDTKDLYNIAIDNVTKSGWLVGVEAVKGKIPPVKYKQLLVDITPPPPQTPQEVTPQTPIPTDSKKAKPDKIHPGKFQ